MAFAGATGEFVSGALSVQYHVHAVLTCLHFHVCVLPYLSPVTVFQNVTCPTTSFTDLAEIVSRIEPVKAPVADGEWGDPSGTAGAWGRAGVDAHPPVCHL